MRVLHVINALEVGGAEKFVILLIAELRRQNIQADLLVLENGRTIFHEQLEAKGVLNTRSLGVSSSYNLLTPVKLAYFLAKEASNYDIYHSHLFPSQYWSVFSAIGSRVKGKLVTTEQNTTNRRRENAFFQFLDKYVYRRYAAVTSVSPIATKYLRKYIASNGTQVITIPNAIELSVFENVEAIDLVAITGSPPSSLFAIQVSTFTPQKDHDTLIKAIAMAKENLHLILVGVGERLDQMKLLADSLEVSHRVHFLGIRDDIPSLLVSADIAVLSSHYEGLSLSLIEAFASGTPFIGTDAPGLGDIARKGGVSVEHENIDDLASTLNSLCEDERKREEISKRGLSLAQNYSIEKIAGQYISVYESVMAKRSVNFGN